MEGITSKGDLAVYLSQLKSWEKPDIKSEQYATPGESASEWLWQAMMNGDIRSKIVVDAGCGNGVLGIGALLLGAKEVFFIDNSMESMRLCEENVQKVRVEFEIGKTEFLHVPIQLFDHQVDTVLQNPPFGTKEEHLDKAFLEKAFATGKVVWSMHKWSTKAFVEAVARDNGFMITDVKKYLFPIKAFHILHRKPTYDVEAGLWRMEKR